MVKKVTIKGKIIFEPVSSRLLLKTNVSNVEKHFFAFLQQKSIWSSIRVVSTAVFNKKIQKEMTTKIFFSFEGEGRDKEG